MLGMGFIPHSGRGGLAGWLVRSSFSTIVVVALAERYGLDFGGVEGGEGRGQDHDRTGTRGRGHERATATSRKKNGY